LEEFPFKKIDEMKERPLLKWANDCAASHIGLHFEFNLLSTIRNQYYNLKGEYGWNENFEFLKLSY